ncbi:MAG: proline--tRNA ligase [Capsulimonadales bacterium]|nr:proline--tRNA ligase [Capsulimonadales bacterium]
MKVSRYFIPTLRDVPAEAEIASHQLLLRAGFIRKLSAGVYSYLPLGWRVLRKVEQIIRSEMEAIDCLEMRMPTLHPREMLEESGRWNVDVVYKLKDRRDADLALGFTHEEIMADIARRDMRSWRDLPRRLFQVQTKFRDEPRPRGGVIRTREFIMYDAYSFDRDETGMGESYRMIRDAYDRIFLRLGLKVLTVEADGGAIGDLENHEFMVLAEAGEDTVLRCPHCGYAANAEKCPVFPPDPPAEATNGVKPLEIVATPGARTIEEVTGMLATTADNLVKTLLFLADGDPVAVLVRGDREVNEIKLRRFLNAGTLEMAGPETVEKITGAPVGFAGPTGLIGLRILADHEVRPMKNFITGANQADAHYVHVNIGRDFTPSDYADLRIAVAGDRCPICEQGTLEEARGIEVGHIFQLGTKYSGAMGANYTDDQGTIRPILMGSYGIGISRLLAAILETSHDADGMIWHPAVAPFQVVLVVANVKDEAAAAAGQKLHDDLIADGLEVLLDDRDERAGVKFKDADLIGIPVRVVIGKGLAGGKVEIRARKDAASGREIPIEETLASVRALLESLR